MSETDSLNESHAIAKLTESYKFDLEKKEHKEILKNLVKIAEKRIDNEPVMASSNNSHSRRMALIGVMAAVVTVSFALWLNHLNHIQNVQLQEMKITRQK